MWSSGGDVSGGPWGMYRKTQLLVQRLASTPRSSWRFLLTMTTATMISLAVSLYSVATLARVWTGTEASNVTRLWKDVETRSTTRRLMKELATRDTQVVTEGEKVVYDGYARVYERRMRVGEDGETFAYDIWGRAWRNESFSVVTTVPFDVKTQTFTLIREMNPAHERFVYSFPQGVMERGKHADVLAAAKAELEEEGRLGCHKWMSLLKTDVGMPQDKYQRESVFVYLCADSFQVEHAARRDREEGSIEIVRGVTTKQFVQLCELGALQSNNVAAGLLALQKLRESGLLVGETGETEV